MKALARLVVVLLLLGPVLSCTVPRFKAGADARDSARKPVSQRQEAVTTREFRVPLPPGAVRRLGSVAFHPGGDPVLWSPNGDMLASCGAEGGSVRLWDARTGAELRKLDDCARAAFAPDGKTLFAAVRGGDGAIWVWETHTGRRLRTLQVSGGRVWFLALSPDGKTISVGGKHIVALLDAGTGKELHRLPLDGGSGRRLAFSPDGKVLACGGAGKGVLLWDVGTGQQVRKLGTHGNVPIAFSPDGKTLASGSEWVFVRLWDIGTGELVRTFQIDKPEAMNGHYVRSVAFSPDGELLAVAGGGNIYLWNVATGAEVHRLQAHADSLTFSPDGKTLASAGKTILLWDVAAGECLVRRSGHGEGVGSVAFGPDGRTLVSVAFWEGSIIWEPATGKELRRIPDRKGGGRAVLTADGKTLVSIKLWGSLWEPSTYGTWLLVESWANWWVTSS